VGVKTCYLRWIRTCVLESSGDRRDTHSFPTRRSSDLLLPDLGETDSGDRPRWCSPIAAIPPAPPCSPVRASPASAAPRLGTTSSDRKSTRLNSSHVKISYAVFCLKKKNKITPLLYNIT